MLHIYGQQFWHCDARIVGTPEDLIRLRRQIDYVLLGDVVASGHNSAEAMFFPSDGEGYLLKVSAVTEDKLAKLPHQCIDECCGKWSPDEMAALRSLDT